jgi:hypothetical protein
METSFGKWKKYKLMKEVKELSSHLPKTLLFSEKSLWGFIDKYNEVVYKPCSGCHGRGVILVTSMPSDQYELHENNKKTILNGRKETFDYLNQRQMKPNSHIVQQRIHFAEIDNSAFDLRVIVQRNQSLSSWEVTGIIARAIADNFFTSNFTKKLMTAEDAFTRSRISNRKTSEILNEVNNISLVTANYLEKYYGKYTTISVDMAPDNVGKLWIIEVNLKPSIKLFARLDDKSMYERIKENLKR